MKKSTIYIADDGTRFDDEDRCRKYEDQCARIEQALSLLPPLPKTNTCDFANGHGFIQHKRENAIEAYQAVLEVARGDIIPEDVADKALLSTHEFAPRSIVGRYLDDSGHRAIYKAWQRFMNMDSLWREWGQGYYAVHPDMGQQIRLNP